jgi:ankyrin repeat protein
MMRALIASGANVNALNAKKATPLMLAADYGNEETTKELLENGALPDELDSDGDLPICVAVRRSS